MKTLKYLSILFIYVITFMSCEDLDVKNTNEPDFATATSNPSDLKGVASGLYNYFYLSANFYENVDQTLDRNTPAFAMWVAADAGTCSWGNFGMNDLSKEPRQAFDNTPSYDNRRINEDFYNAINALISSANDILIQTINNGVKIETGEIDETPMVNAMAYFAQGIGIGYLGLVYDKAFIVTEATDLTAPIETSAYTDMIAASLASFDKAIAICNNNTFTIPAEWIPCTPALDNVTLGQLINSYAARILGNSPRNKAGNDALDWQKVYDYASKGIDFDFVITMDDIVWFNYYRVYSCYAGWGQVDMRVIHMMDPDMPAAWPGANGFEVIPAPKDETNALDARLITDYEFLSSCPFRPDRGYYQFSCYRLQRYDDYVDNAIGPLTDFHQAENDLMKAEAALKLNDLAEAAAIINAGTRVTRGGLAPVAEDAAAIEDAIFYERNVELMNANLGTEFFAMRKADLLQKGTFLHLPIPGSQLEVMLMDYYTFGGAEGVSGEDISAKGWNE